MKLLRVTRGRNGNKHVGYWDHFRVRFTKIPGEAVAVPENVATGTGVIAIARGDDQFENLLRNYLLAFEKIGLFVSLHKKWFEIGNRNIYEP